MIDFRVEHTSSNYQSQSAKIHINPQLFGWSFKEEHRSAEKSLRRFSHISKTKNKTLAHRNAQIGNVFVNAWPRIGASLQQPGYLYLGAQGMQSEVRLIFISCVASASSRQRSFEERRTLRGG